jgi:glycosyltransferase involved in cell wall biosynthesis
VEALRAELQRALGGRRVWFYGMLGRSRLDQIRGGQRVVLEHCAILRNAGIEATAVRSQGRAARRFPFLGDGLPDRPGDEIRPLIALQRDFEGNIRSDRDFVVIPGRNIASIHQIPGEQKVAFSQAISTTMRSLGLERRDPDPWKSDQLLAVMCVSRGNAAIAQLAEPACPVIVVKNSVDSSRFRPVEKRRLVVSGGLDGGCEKNAADTASAVQTLLTRAKRAGRPIDFVTLENMTHSQVAAALSEARVLVFLSMHEGFPLLMLEAMASGTLVFAYRRSPMSDAVPDRCLFDFGDLQGVVEAVEHAVEHPEEWEPEMEAGRRLAAEYGPEEQERSVLEAWLTIAGRAAERSPDTR